MNEKYVVIYPFKDLKDKDKKIYAKGDRYSGSVAQERLQELTTKNNKIGTPLIELEKEEK